MLRSGHHHVCIQDKNDTERTGHIRVTRQQTATRIGLKQRMKTQQDSLISLRVGLQRRRGGVWEQGHGQNWESSLRMRCNLVRHSVLPVTYFCQLRKGKITTRDPLITPPRPPLTQYDTQIIHVSV